MNGINYFDMFGMVAKYALDKNNLKKTYLQLQAKCHPDRASNNSEKLKFLDESMQINTGYKILMDDYSRAKHLLEIYGQEITDENSKNILSKEDFESIWEKNEQIEEVDTNEAMFALEKNYLAEQEVLVRDLQRSFESKNISKALELTVKLKYLTSLVKNIRLKIRDANN